MHPLDLVGASAWRRAVFTTYALSLSFFEAVVLDRLVRAGARNTLILSDPEGVRAGLSEQGARRVGREYELEPLACRTGVFHPKLSIFFGDASDVHMLVGSGNLTFGGWGVNLECVEHLHPSFASDAFYDAADLFEMMSIDDRITSGVADELATIGGQLRQAAEAHPRRGNFRLLHNVGITLFDQVAELVRDLGGARRVTIVSPFFDVGGKAIARLSEVLECEDVHLHAHPAACVQGLPGTNWPNGTRARSVNVVEPFGIDHRSLHAKCFEILCQRGRLLISGSANATLSALGTGNIEASVARIQRETLVGWTTIDSDPPIQVTVTEEDKDAEAGARVGILRAVLDGEMIQGLVVQPRIVGNARLSRVRAAGVDVIGEVEIDREGRFAARAPNLEIESWQSGRIVIRLEQADAAAEGFVSVSAAAEIIRRAGSMAPRILAMLAGTETPADVAAIFAWMNEGPQRLFAINGTGSENGSPTDRAPIWVSASTLHEPQAFSTSQNGVEDRRRDQAWKRSWQMLCASFSKSRGPWEQESIPDSTEDEDEETEDEAARAKRTKADEEAKAKAMVKFEELLEAMLAPANEGRHVSMAFALAHYLSDRIEPAPARVQIWLTRILGSLRSPEPESKSALATAALLLHSAGGRNEAASTARRFLIRHGILPSEVEIAADQIGGFIRVLAPAWDAAAFLEEVKTARTPGEEVTEYLRAASSGDDPESIQQLRSSRHWSRLAQGLAQPEIRDRFEVLEISPTACPRCNMQFPTAAREELRSTGVTRCCQIILSKEV